MGTARSLLDKVNSDYNDFRNIVTGAASDGWYPASLPGALPPPSPLSCFAPVVCFGPPSATTSCEVSTNPIVMSTLPCNNAASFVGSIFEVLEQANAIAACVP